MSSQPKLPLKSVSWLTLLNLASAVVGLLQTIVVAWLFGATRTVEVFFAATTFQQLLMQFAASGQIGDLFVPLFHEIEADHGTKHAREAFSVMTNVMVLSGLAVATVAVLLARPISVLLVPGFGEPDQALTAQAFVVMAPMIVVLIANAMFMHLLRAEHRYGISETLAFFSKLVNLVVLLCFAQTLGVWALIFGLWITAVIHLGGQFYYAWRGGYRHQITLRSEYFHPRSVLFKIPLTFTHVLSAQFFAFTLTATLSLLPEGSYAAYSYAKRLQNKFKGMVLQPVGIVFFNHFSQSLAQGSVVVRSYADHALGLMIATVAICLVPIASGGDLVLAALWGSETFPPERIQQAYWIWCALTILLIFNAQYLISRRTNLALKIVGRQFAASGSVMILAGLLCYWLIPRFGLTGAVAIQFVGGIGTAAVTLAVLFLARRDLVCTLSLVKLLQWSVAAVLAIACDWGIRELCFDMTDVSRQGKFFYGVVLAITGFVLLIASSLVLRIPESYEIVAKLRQRVRRLRGATVEC